MKLFKPSDIDTVKFCQEYFDFYLHSIMIEKHRKTFLAHLDTVGFMDVY